MQSRKEARAAKRKERRNKVAKSFAIGGLCFITVGGGAIWAVSQSTPNVSSIEKHVPQDVDALFMSVMDDESWDYFKTISGYKNISSPINAKNIAVSFKNGKSYLYVQGDNKLDKELVERNIIPVDSVDDVYLLAGADDGLVDSGLGTAEDYAGKGINDGTSFGYVTNRNIKKGFFDEKSGIPSQDWEWVGKFNNTQWSGKVKGISANDFDMNKFDKWVGFEKKPAWLNNAFTENEEGVVNVTLTPRDISEITGDPQISSDIVDITSTLNSDGVMDFKFER